MSLNYASLTNDINVFDNFASVPQVIETIADIQTSPPSQEQPEEDTVLVSSAPEVLSEDATQVEESTQVEEENVIVPAESESIGAPISVPTEETQETEEAEIEQEPKETNNVRRITKSWNSVFTLFDLTKDGKLDKYEAMLLLATIKQVKVTSINESLLLAENNVFKTNLENIKKAEFITACKNLLDDSGNRLSSTTVYYTLNPRRAKYHDSAFANKLVEESIVVPEIQEEENETGGGISMYNIILIILIVLLLASLLSKE